jgi:hypothetical protein
MHEWQNELSQKVPNVTYADLSDEEIELELIKRKEALGSAQSPN